jgi:uncharacterized protein (DUF1697 family)
MKTYVVLLRGINVGGHKKVPMVELRELLSKSGFKDVRTYIQSGNIILQSSHNKAQIAQKVKDAIHTHFGFEVPVIVRTKDELTRNYNICPFSEVKKDNSYFVLLSDVPHQTLVDDACKIKHENEEFQIIEDCIYFYSSVGYGNSKFNMNSFEKKLNVKATSRNHKTMVKLMALASENEKEH